MSSTRTHSMEQDARAADEVGRGADNRPDPIAGDPTGERIDADDDRALAEWARKLDTTAQQLREAISAVGDRAADVEMHLKGSHSTTNADRVKDANGA